MKDTPLTHWHERHGARMTDFHGWRMPLQYTSITDEHLAVRRAAGLFDLGHMGRIRIHGPDRIAFAQRMTTSDVASAKEGRVLYGFLCNHKGGIRDDITAYRAADHVFLVVNASNRTKIVDWLIGNRDPNNVTIEDATETLGMIALQGPLAQSLLQETTDFPLHTIAYYHFVCAPIADSEALVSRTGYTGEDGFEVYLPNASCERLWNGLMERGKDRGAVPVGLGARDTLRLEAAMPLYGNELGEDLTPYEAGLGKFVDLRKGDFIGRAALLAWSQASPPRRLCCLVMHERAVPRKGYAVFADNKRVGEVTSGTFSPTLGQGIAFAYVDSAFGQENTTLQVEIRGNKRPARVVRRPFYKRRRD